MRKYLSSIDKINIYNEANDGSCISVRALAKKYKTDKSVVSRIKNDHDGAKNNFDTTKDKIPKRVKCMVDGCEKSSKHGTKCLVHTYKELKVKVSPSNIIGAGYGLIAYNGSHKSSEVIFKKNQKIMEYTGTMKEEGDKIFGEGYLLALKRGSLIDASNRYSSSVARYINTAGNSGFKNNARFSINRKNNQVNVVATMDIKNNEEIFVSYGTSFVKQLNK